MSLAHYEYPHHDDELDYILPFSRANSLAKEIVTLPGTNSGFTATIIGVIKKYESQNLDSLTAYDITKELESLHYFLSFQNETKTIVNIIKKHLNK